ncbi:beta-galactosidase [Curtobacterium sp. MCBA15_001]|uniref:beta-galactosidase n=1 Tax=Curtobacterium sp. MCBA15_001 TaxID=1898731 RepID=UPI0008DE05E6|nr:beta-galactosidase [Curtobacterium sp. MCBA15_001]OIH92503.1 beta-galactosidase [Curtobacterium sp. MCBA15_001]
MTTTLPAPATTALGLGSTGLAFGCDYNPEQWDPQVWVEDVRLMREAGVNLVAINVFGWSHVEPHQGEYDFSALDRVIELLHGAGIGVDLGTGTASTPPWLTTAHPEVLPVVADGTTRWPGGRQAFCPSSPVYREHALALVRATAERYGDHPAVKLWHVSNELGCHNAYCFCDVSADAFRDWLRNRYGTVEALNAAWGTAFWSQRYSDWDQVLPPRATLSFTNPGQTLDFDRFSSDELLGHHRAEVAVLRELSDKPVTTNFMVAAHITALDYWTWADDMDVIANDHYLDHRLARPQAELAFAADTTRGLAKGGPWLLMEHSTGAVNWQPRNVAKDPGQMLRDTVSHIARGADGVCFFQWRQSVQGSEKFHSAMLPHAGTDSQTWRDVVALGAVVERLGELRGSRVVADVAVVFSWEVQWAADLEAHPTTELRYLEQVHAFHAALTDLGLTVDVVAPGAPLDGYGVVVVPELYLVRDEHAAVIAEHVERGGQVVVTFFSGVVDGDDRVRTGGYPGAFRDLLGVRVDEFRPLAAGQTLGLSDGSRAHTWSEPVTLHGATAVTTYTEGPLAGSPAVTRNAVGAGGAWYVSTVLEDDARSALLRQVLDAAGVRPDPVAEPGLEVVRRRDDQHEWVFLLNHSDHQVAHTVTGHELVVDRPVDGATVVAPGGTQIIRTDRKHA